MEKQNVYLMVEIPKETLDWFENGFPDEKDGELAINVIKNGFILSAKQATTIKKELLTTPDAAQLYNIEDKSSDAMTEDLDVIKKGCTMKTLSDAEKALEVESVHKMNDVNQDYAHNKRIMAKLPLGMPEKVRKDIDAMLKKEAHNDHTSSMSMEKELISFHKKKTKDFIKMENDKKHEATINEVFAKGEAMINKTDEYQTEKDN